MEYALTDRGTFHHRITAQNVEETSRAELAALEDLDLISGFWAMHFLGRCGI
jgi:hypothetical protein